MAIAQIAASLSYMAWALLGALALGSLATVWLLAQVTEATRGFLVFTALCAAVLGGLWLLVDWSLPAPGELAIGAAPEVDEARRLAIGLFSVLALVAARRLAKGGRATIAGALAIAFGVAAMAAAAIGWAGGTLLGVPLLIQLLALSTVTGGSLAAVILAHWYLVTPRISERPLVLVTRLLVLALSVQLLLFASWQVVGHPDGAPFGALRGDEALFVVMRLTIGLLFPLVLAFMAYRTAQTRSMESATGLLYIELAAVMASTIVAAALAFSVGLLV
jgi:hypothetical protein